LLGIGYRSWFWPSNARCSEDHTGDRLKIKDKPAFVEMQDIGPELLVVEPVGRPVEMPGQSGDLREVDVDGLIVSV
jgi:hypothetical protein